MVSTSRVWPAQLRACSKSVKPTCKHYHSTTHPRPPAPFSAIKSLILSASLKHVPTHGFTRTSLALGAKEAGYIDASTNLFARGPFSLVLYHLFTQRIALSERLSLFDRYGQDGLTLSPGVKLELLTWDRLMSNRPFIGRWQEALALMAMPINTYSSLSELALLADEILFLCGDHSMDTTWYTKRTSLSTIYATSELFMTTDKSENFRDTKDFLHHRFEESKAFETTINDLVDWVEFAAAASINVLRSKGIRI